MEISELIPVRYTVLGTIDGVVAVLAIILGVAAISTDKSVVIAAGLSGSIGLGISNGIGGFLAEHTVEMKKLRDIEDAMLRKKGDMDGTIIHRKVQKKLYYDTITHGGCSFGGAIVPVSPFFFDLSIGDATIASVVISLSVLFLLGIYMGIMTKENLILTGVKMLVIGVIVAIVVSFIEQFL